MHDDQRDDAAADSPNEVAIIEPEGRMRLGHGDLALRESIDEALAAGARSILIDFGKTTRMDFSCLGELSVAKRKADHAGRDLTLRNLPARVQEVLQIARYGRDREQLPAPL